MKKLKLSKKFVGGYNKFFLDKKTKEELDNFIPIKIISNFDDDDTIWDDDTVLL